MSTHPETTSEYPGCPTQGWIYRVGEFISSARRPDHVLCLAVSTRQIQEFQEHPDFVRWVSPEPLSQHPAAAAIDAAMREAGGTRYGTPEEVLDRLLDQHQRIGTERTLKQMSQVSLPFDDAKARELVKILDGCTGKGSAICIDYDKLAVLLNAAAAAKPKEPAGCIPHTSDDIVRALKAHAVGDPVLVGTWAMARAAADLIEKLQHEVKSRAVPNHPLPPVPDDVLPPLGSTVWIRHGRDGDLHECVVVGYFAHPDLGGSSWLQRVCVRVRYAANQFGVDNARNLRDLFDGKGNPLLPRAEPKGWWPPVGLAGVFDDLQRMYNLSDYPGERDILHRAKLLIAQQGDELAILAQRCEKLQRDPHTPTTETTVTSTIGQLSETVRTVVREEIKPLMNRALSIKVEAINPPEKAPSMSEIVGDVLKGVGL